jgi:hypothetical protein
MPFSSSLFTKKKKTLENASGEKEIQPGWTIHA